MLAAICNIARQTAQGQPEAAGDQHQRADQRNQQPHSEQHFAQVCHVSVLSTIVTHRAQPKRIARAGTDTVT